MNTTEEMSYPENPLAVSWESLDRSFWKMVNCDHDFSQKTGTEVRNPSIRNWAFKSEEFTCPKCGAVKSIHYYNV